MADPTTGKATRVTQYIREADLVKLHGLEGKDYELYDPAKHRDIKATHITFRDKVSSFSDKAVGAPTKRDKKGFFGE